MNYSALNNTILPQVLATVALINNPEVDPEVRQLNQEILFREVGAAIYAKIYDMNAFDMEIQYTTGNGIDDRYYGLAKVLSDSISTGDSPNLDLITNYLNSMTALAQNDAMKTAKQSGKHPIVTRTPTGLKTCAWCESKAGTYVDPPGDVFARHRGCDCSIETSGYNSRNGTLNNYVAKV